jgi:CheY-like chemotaxis protein
MPERPSQSVVSDDLSPRSERRGRRVLIADDDVDSATSLAMLLEFSGHQVSIAHDGRRAVELAELEQPDVIVLDIGMPVMNGHEAAMAIRASDRGKRVVLIALTGWGENDDRQRTRDAGFDAHRVKPVDPMEVIDLIAKLTAGKDLSAN